MKFKFQKDIEYQKIAIDSVIDIFAGAKINNTEVLNNFQLQADNVMQIVKNELEITGNEILKNIKDIQQKNNLIEKDKDGNTIKITDEKNIRDITIEMETGTGKTYVYLRTIFELYQKYNLKKFIILVPSVAIREGVIKSISQMKEHFKMLYDGVNFISFGYDSDKLSEVRDFVQGDVLQIMIMTVQSFNKDTTIMRKQIDKFQGEIPLDLVARTRPVVIMDEPQNMESDLAKEAIKDLQPIFKLRYSATHKEIYNLVYKLTPLYAYSKGLVKKIEVFGIEEINNNDLLIKVLEIKTQKGKNPTAKILLENKNTDGEYFEKEYILKVEDFLKRKTNNENYKDLFVSDINAIENRVELSNGKFYFIAEEKNKSDIFRVQIRETIKAHFDKQKKLKSHEIKVLSLFFIDKVDNYVLPQSLIRNIFNEEFDKLKVNYDDFKNSNCEEVHKGYFASKKIKGNIEYNDSKSGTSKEDKEVYDLIMKDKEKLLSFSEKTAFIFSHSALKEGWDNPNIFQICTLRESNSLMKKRQEIGRGLRLSVNQNGDRIYDTNINRLTVIPNESYKRFCEVYQQELDDSGYKTITPDNARKNRVSIKTNKFFDSKEFMELWNKINQKTKYILEINKEIIVRESVKEINNIVISINKIAVIGAEFIVADREKKIRTTQTRNSVGDKIISEYKINNFIERISKETKLTKQTIFNILKSVNNQNYLNKNYEDYIRQIIKIINDIKNNILINEGLKYIPTGDIWEASICYQDIQDILENKVFNNINGVALEKSPTDGIEYDSDGEREFAESLEQNINVKVWTKLPKGFKVDTPLGDYIPDWAILWQDGDEAKLYLVRETKFYNKNLEDVLKKDEANKIKCAEKHFKAINVNFKVSKEKDLSDLI